MKVTIVKAMPHPHDSRWGRPGEPGVWLLPGPTTKEELVREIGVANYAFALSEGWVREN